jgi:hypothetical protein
MRTQFTGIGIHIKVADIGRSREFYENLGSLKIGDLEPSQEALTS